MSGRPDAFLLPARRGCLSALAISLCMLNAAHAAAAAASSDVATLDEMRAALADGKAIVIDIREPDEHAGGIAPGARRLPMSQMRQRLAEVPTDPSKPVLLVCRTQNRSSATWRALREMGRYGHVRYVQGGMSEWAARGWPMVKP